MEENMNMEQKIDTIYNFKEKIQRMPSNSVDVLVISTYFDPTEKYISQKIALNDKLTKLRLEKIHSMIRSAVRVLKDGGLLFIYGIPKWLPYAATFLDDWKDEKFRMIFKYWIALDIDDRGRQETLPPAHVALLMYLKSRKDRKSPTPFKLNTKTVRVPYQACAACGQNIRDWGGKKHLLNPLGAALSDVWRDFPKVTITDNILPDFVLERVYKFVEKDSLSFVHIIEQKSIPIKQPIPDNNKHKHHGLQPTRIDDFIASILDKVLLGDSINFMREIYKHHPEGIFDLVFADPPYNLEKNYGKYTDATPERRYIKWCESWLGLMAKVLKPGGTLMVLNLPKWCTHHGVFLNEMLDFKHWIVWDALSLPAGKLMPAHYSLLYYTKSGSDITFNYNIVRKIDADKYCLRDACISRRKANGDDEKVDLDDIWWDVHRIKHKRDRDQHPCQLPIKLMKRIIQLTTNVEDIVFDPFCGVGTTAITAKMTNRHFVTIDIDENYVDITKQNLEKLQPTLFGAYYLPRKSVNRKMPMVTKKEIECGYIQLCKEKKRVLSLDEVASLDCELGTNILDHYPSFKVLMKIARRRL